MLLFRLTLTPTLEERARRQAERGLVGRLEGHAEMDVSVAGGWLLSRLLSGRGLTAISCYFVMDWSSAWPDLLVGLAIAAVNADAAREVWEAARKERRATP